MNRDSRILIIYSTFGDGHLQTANAVKQQLVARGINQIHMIDLMAEAYPYWNSVSRFYYIKSSAWFPSLYGLSYSLTNGTRPDGPFNRMIHSIGKRKLQEIVERIQPDAVIHTFPFLAMEQLIRELAIPVPTFTVITDYVLHSRWIHPGTQHYFIATESLKREMMAAGISENKISVTGIPIKEAFDTPVQTEELFIKYGFDSRKKHALIVAGAFGVLAHVRKMVAAVLDQTEYDLILVCGRNRSLTSRMEALYANNSRVRVLGYVDRMDEMMGVASCLITKAGGITLTEALSRTLPVIVYRPLPGQEEGNAAVLSDAGAIRIADRLEDVTNILNQIQENTHLQRLKKAMKSLYKPGAASAVASEILQISSMYAHGNQPYPTPLERKALQTHGYQ
jgi:processive 1,2-diacylglycerol beta-glucosyltransferase